jgi:hypothetical protein
MNFLKAAVLSAALVTAGAVTAGAVEPASTTPANPPQVAANPRTTGPKIGPSAWIPATPSVTTPNSGVDTEGHYSRKGFGPSPDCSSGQTC